VIPRYTLPEMGAVWTERARFEAFVRVEVLACEAHAELGLVPREALEAIRVAPVPDPARVAEIEETTQHDVIAFLTAFGEGIAGDASRYVHYGMTSSDLLDTSLAVQLVAACDLLLAKLDRLVPLLRDTSLAHRDTVMVGRTHGVHAEPTTFGHVVALWAFACDRARTRLCRARETIAVGKISGAVGTYSNVDPFVEAYVCRELGLTPAPAANQVVQRDRHAELVAACALAGTALETIALAVRHFQRTEVREVEEPFGKGQKGSSAMPHKRNPIICERICGLARLLRANAMAAMENVALWHERDISHSSVERVILPDTAICLDYMLHLTLRLVEGMTVHPGRMRANLESSGGLVYSQSVLLHLVDAGMSREAAYRVVQAAAMRTWNEGTPFRETLPAEPEAAAVLSAADLDRLFDPMRYFANLGGVFERVAALV